MLYKQDLRKICFAVIIQAIRDSQSGDESAKEWLWSEGIDWAVLFGFNLGDMKPIGRVSYSSILDFSN